MVHLPETSVHGRVGVDARVPPSIVREEEPGLYQAWASMILVAAGEPASSFASGCREQAVRGLSQYGSRYFLHLFGFACMYQGGMRTAIHLVLHLPRRGLSQTR